MNIYDFFASSDIVKHCMAIKHQFSALDQAVIIALSDNSLRAKIVAWQWLIDNSCDMQIAGNHAFKARESLHECLREVIADETARLRDFYTPKNGYVYQVHVVVIDNSSTLPTGCFTTAEKALAAFGELWDWDADGIASVALHRFLLDSQSYDSAYLDRNYEPVFIHQDKSYGNGLIHLFIDIPMPFNKGDLVEVGGRICVLESLPHWTTVGKLSYDLFVAGKVGDGFDNQAVFYFMDDEGRFTWEHGSYLDMKLFTGELKGLDRFLSYVCKIMKYSDATLLSALPAVINAYMQVKSEEEGKLYSEEMLRFPGFLEG